MRLPRNLTVWILSCLCTAGCGVRITDQTPSAIARNASGVYEVSAKVRRSGTGTDVLNVRAVIDGVRFPLSRMDGDEWLGNIELDPCKNGFNLVYEAEWDATFGDGTEVEPKDGTIQKWLTGTPPAACPIVFGRSFTVASQEDAPDTDIEDGICRAAGGECTLRAAVMQANASPGTDRILLSAATYRLTREGSDNTALNGDLDILDSLTIEAPNGDAVLGAAGMNDRIFDIFSEAVVTMRNLTICNARAAGAGGGVWNRGVLFLEHVTIEDNRTGSGLGNPGGGVYTEGPLIVAQTHIRRNISGHFGGGIAIAGNGSAVLTQSAVTGNKNETQHGGGIAVLGGSLEAQNVTISGNETPVYGGGIYASRGATVTFLNVTIARNRADNDGSGDGSGGSGGGFLLANSERPYRFGHTIVAENYVGRVADRPDDCYGKIFSLGYNLLEETARCTIEGITVGNITGLYKADLEELRFWGGLTPVHRLGRHSEAQDAGNPSPPNDASLVSSRESDQRGVLRPDGSSAPGAVCDIGAVEMEP